LKYKFKPFFDSEKTIELNNPKHTSAYHGKNGVGRLTFFTFAQTAEWETIYKLNDKTVKCIIKIDENKLEDFDSEKTQVELNFTGTKVKFENIKIRENELLNSVIPFLVKEFCWFIELNKSKGFLININGKELDYSNYIAEKKENIIFDFKNKIDFTVKYIRWKESLNKEYSKFYYINSKGNELYKNYTTFNNKGDDFFHSVYIQSNFFDLIDFKANDNDNQGVLFRQTKSSDEYKFIISRLNEFLKNKRKPFLKKKADEVINLYENEGVFPKYSNEWETKYRKNDLKLTIRELYQVQPKLFVNLNREQKSTFVRFLDLLLDSNEREHIFDILEEIIDLTSKEKEYLSKLFKVTKLNRIIDTIKLIEDRYKAYYALNDLVFNTSLKANEVNHLQKIIEQHYWIFGEEYHLVTAAEPKFQEALKRYTYLLTGNVINKKIDHPDKQKEMDIFACRQNFHGDKIENIIVELKHPLIKLGRKQYEQVDKYLEVILSQKEFNASNMYWKFYLIGNDFDKTGYINRLIETNKPHGLNSLIQSLENGRILVYANDKKRRSC